MSFPADLTSVLTGVTTSQLSGWRRTGLLIPEVQGKNPPLYSFRDLQALRTVARLRADTSLQKVRKAFARLPEFDLTDHLSTYSFATDGDTIAVWTDEGFMDIVAKPGQFNLYTIDDIYRPFRNVKEEEVADFERPREHLRVNPERLGGWPTVDGTRVPYDTVAHAMRGDEIAPEDLRFYYPGVSSAAAADALDFAADVESRRAS